MEHVTRTPRKSRNFFPVSLLRLQVQESRRAYYYPYNVHKFEQQPDQTAEAVNLSPFALSQATKLKLMFFDCHIL